MNRNELILQLNEIHSNVTPNNLTQSLRVLGYPHIKEQIIKFTQYLPSDVKFKIRYYHILNGLDSVPMCSICGVVPIKAFGTIENGYRADKCRSCSAKIHTKRTNLGRILRNDNYWLHYNYLKDDYVIKTTHDEFVETGIMEYVHNECGKTTSRSVAYRNGCKWCANNPTSKAEIELRNWLTQYIEIEHNKRMYLDNKYELDIFVPSKRIGIEYHGLWFHSQNAGISKRYHLDKLEKAESKDIRLIQVFENEWTHKKDIVKSVILSKLDIYENRIYARKCQIKMISHKMKNEFLELNHLQGRDNSKDCMGLFCDDELVSVMTFGRRNIGRKTQLEMLRYCCKLNTQIIGGASKLFKFYINIYNGEYDYIKTFADKRYSDGRLYDLLGFIDEGDSPPNYWYFKKNEDTLYHRANFMKHKLSGKLDVYDGTLTEYQNMVNNKYNRIFDCGNKIYKYKLI